MTEYTSLISEKSCRACLTYFSGSGSKYKLISIYEKVNNTGAKDFIVYDALKKINIQIDKKDVLPKFICHSCLKSLKDAYNFRELCISSENKYMNKLKHFSNETDIGEIHSLNNVGFEVEVLRKNLVNNNNPISKFNKEEIKIEAAEVEEIYEEPIAVTNIKTENDMAEIDVENPSKVHSKHSANLLDVIRDLKYSNESTDFSESEEKDIDYDPFEDDLNSRSTTSSDIDEIYNSETKSESDTKLEDIERTKLSQSENRKAKNDKNIEFNKITPRRRTQKEKPEILKGIVFYPRENFQVEGLITKCKNCCKYFFTSRIKVHYISCRRMLYNFGVEHLPIEDDPNKYTCFYCSENFESIDLIEEHIITKHDKNNPYPCPICGKVFSHFGSHRFHVESHNKKLPMFECELCGKYFTASKLKKHMSSHDNIARKCEICGKTFMNTDRLNYHMSSHSNPHKCKYCEKLFSNSHQLKEHERVHTGERPYECHICDKKYKIRNQLLVHIYKHPNAEFNCSLCKKGFTSNEDLTKHLRRHETHDYQCEICGQLLATLRVYQEHKLIHENPKKAQIKIQAKKISKSIRRKTRYVYPTKKYKCSLCTDEFRLPIGLEKHLKMHDPNRPFPCHVCNKAYKLKRHLQQHINKDHSNGPQYPCEICKKFYKDVSARNQHMVQIHNVSGNLTKCSFCCKKFLSRENLEKHEKTHSRNICDFCGKEYSTRYRLLMHKEDKHSGL